MRNHRAHRILKEPCLDSADAPQAAAMEASWSPWNTSLNLQANSACPKVLETEWGLQPDALALVPRLALNGVGSRSSASWHGDVITLPAISGYSETAASGSLDPVSCGRSVTCVGDGALPELRRRSQDHCGDSGSARDREDPHALGSAGQGTRSGASPWSGAASGLTSPNPNRSGDPAVRVAGVGCVREFAGPMTAVRGSG